MFETNAFDNFTSGVIKTLMIAQEESKRSGHNFVSGEHILLGLLGSNSFSPLFPISFLPVPDSIGARALKRLAVDRKEVRRIIGSLVRQEDDRIIVETPLTASAMKVIQASMSEAHALEQSARINTGHLFLGLLLVQDGILGEVLEQSRINMERAREITLALLKGNSKT